MKNVIISQYKASLTMLMDVMEKCPDDLWEDSTYDSAYWRIVYHTLFFTALYISKNEEKFVPWTKHIKDYNDLGPLSDDNKPIVLNEIFSKADLMGYAEVIFKSIDTMVNVDADEDSGFSWLPMKKPELHIYNIRHIHHHMGQLIERLHQNGISGISWKRMG
jgi:hypothetical protein